MKKILTSLILTSSLLLSSTNIEDTHQTFITFTKKIDTTNITKEFVYFGTKKDLLDTYNDTYKNISEKGVDRALGALSGQAEGIAKGFYKTGGKALTAGLLTGVVIGLADPFIMGAYSDEEYILIYDITNQSGEKTRVQALFVASDFDDEDTIKKYLEEKINNRVGL